MLNKSPLVSHTLRDDKFFSITFTARNIKNSFFLPRLTRFINRYFYELPLIGIGATLDRYSNTFCIYHSRKDKLRYRNYMKGSKFLNFGSGAFNHKRWQNFDYPGISEYYKNLLGKIGKDYIPIDLNKDKLKIPFDNNSVELIYFSHVLEHLNKKKGIHLFKEFNRILKPGGIVRVVLPHTDKTIFFSSLIDKQQNINNSEKELSTSSSISHTFYQVANLSNSELLKISRENDFKLEKIESKLLDINPKLGIFDPQNPDFHISYWNEERIIKLSEETGFSKIYPLLRGHTFADPFKNLCTFDISEPHLSMYFELIK